jgi:hypothetical protein
MIRVTIASSTSVVNRASQSTDRALSRYCSANARARWFSARSSGVAEARRISRRIDTGWSPNTDASSDAVTTAWSSPSRVPSAVIASAPEPDAAIASTPSATDAAGDSATDAGWNTFETRRSPEPSPSASHATRSLVVTMPHGRWAESSTAIASTPCVRIVRATSRMVSC